MPLGVVSDLLSLGESPNTGSASLATDGSLRATVVVDNNGFSKQYFLALGVGMGLIILLMVIVAVSSPLFLQQLQSAAILPEEEEEFEGANPPKDKKRRQEGYDLTLLGQKRKHSEQPAARSPSDVV